jgi:uncharacterized protein
MLSDPHFYLVAIPAVLLVGLTKGGMGDALSLLGVPILSFAMPPAQAAAILLPILIVMDGAALWSWRRDNDRKTLMMMMPGGLLGVAIGWASTVWLQAQASSPQAPENVMRLIIGTIAILFAARYTVNRWRQMRGIALPVRQPHVGWATFWASFAGYGSFVAHAGGAPYQVYALPLNLDRKTYTGTTVRFFAVLNVVKLIPYFYLGQLDSTNLKASLVMLPLAPLATFFGAWLVRRMRTEIFYPYMYAMVFLAGLKLFFDGITSVFGGA